MKNTLVRKVSLRTIGIIGAILFSVFYAFTFSVPGWVETFAADYIESEAEKRIDQSINGIQPPEGNGALSRLAQTIYDKNRSQIEETKELLRTNAHQSMAAALAQIRDLDCECRKKTEKWLKEGFETNLLLLEAANDRIVDFIHYKYMDIAIELKRDIRIFTASNAGAFLLLLLVSFLKPRAITHLFLPGILLGISTLVCSYFYVFEQNWLLTIIHSEYLGVAYLGWLGFVFLFLCDIVLNRARATTVVINTVANAVGSTLSVVPC